MSPGDSPGAMVTVWSGPGLLGYVKLGVGLEKRKYYMLLKI